MHIFTRFAVSAALSAGVMGGSILGVQPAQASTLSFVLSGIDNATWSLDSNPTPDDSFSGNWFKFNSVAGTANALPFVFTNLTFWSVSNGGGVSTGNADSSGSQNFNDSGPQVYSGTEIFPVFSPGVFALTGDTLTISATSATPLPSTWLMLLSGFLGLGFFAYRGAKKNAAALAAA